MSIHERPLKKGKVYDVSFRDLHGIQKMKTFKSKQSAKTFDIEMKARKAKDDFPELYPRKKRTRFSELAKKWLKQYSRIYKAPSSHKRDEGVVRNHLNPYFGKLDVNRITTEQVEQYVEYRLSAVSPKTKRLSTPATVSREFEILRKIFNDGMKWKLVRRNPCTEATKIKVRPPRFNYLEDDEIARFLDAALPDDRPLFACAVYTGMRLGELINLPKSAVNLNLLLIDIEIGNEESQKNKDDDIRHVPIGTALYPHLVEALQSKGDLVFPSKRDHMKTRRDVRKAFYGALKRAGIERHLRFHDLRHTFASQFVMKGGDLLALKEILGHSSLEMVQRYAHLAPGHLRRGIDRLNFSLQEHRENAHSLIPVMKTAGKVSR